MKLVTDIIKSAAKKRRGGGSRYGKMDQVQDLTADECKFCNCWRCLEKKRQDENS